MTCVNRVSGCDNEDKVLGMLPMVLEKLRGCVTFNKSREIYWNLAKRKRYVF